MNDAVRAALAIDGSSSDQARTIDVTTTGARSGLPRRIETWFYRVDGRIYLTGDPGRRGWYANLRAQPLFTLHLKHGVVADLPARATPVTAEPERRRIFREILGDQPATIDAWVAGSPLVEVAFDSDAGGLAGDAMP